MFIKSKFLTGDVKITDIISENETIKVIGSIKGMYPVEVEIKGQDLKDILANSLNFEVISKTVKLLVES